MINEEFDDDIPDDDFIVDPDAKPARIIEDPEIVEKPTGDFKRILAGQEIWFNTAKPGQFNAWRRYRETLTKRYEALKIRAKKNPSIEALNELMDLSEKFDLATLEFVESLLVDPDNADFIAMEMIGGRITISDVHGVLFNEPEPDDDVAPAPKPKPVRKAAKKAANASRTRK